MPISRRRVMAYPPELSTLPDHSTTAHMLLGPGPPRVRGRALRPRDCDVKTAQRPKKKKDQPGSIDHELVKAMAHPLRYELLMKLDGRTASPMQLSKEVEGSLGTISYHM